MAPSEVAVATPIGKIFQISLPWGEITTFGIRMYRAPSWDEWVEAGRALKSVRRLLHLAIGDWIEIGHSAFGEKYSQALEETGYAYSTLANDAYVSRRIAPPLREKYSTLSHGHFAVVAPLEPKDQDRFLAEAEARSISVHDFREVVPIEKIEKPKPRAEDHLRKAITELALARSLERVKEKKEKIQKIENAIAKLLRAKEAR